MNDTKLEKAVQEIRSGEDAARVVSEWTRYLAAEQAEDGGEMARAAKSLDAPQWGSVVREMFSDLYGSPVDSKVEADPEARRTWVQEAIDRVTATPEWAQLRGTTQGDEWATGLGTAALADSLGPMLKGIAPKTDERAAQAAVDALAESLAAEQSAAESAEAAGQEVAAAEAKEAAERLAERLAEAQAKLAEAQAAADEAAKKIADMSINGLGTEIRLAARGAAAHAAAEISETREAMRALGAGTGAGTPARCASPAAEIREAIARNPRLREVAKYAGRLRAEARKRQQSRTNDAREEVFGVENGGDVARLLPSELANLGDEDTELLLLRKITERAALQYELRGKERAARGPIILLLDESGSMTGERDAWAKATALALADVAVSQKREFRIVHFAGTVSRVDAWDGKRPISIGEIEAMVGWFQGGGTVIARAIGHATSTIRDGVANNKGIGKADVVLVTDGEDHSTTPAHLDALEAAGAGLYVIGIGCPIRGILRERAVEVVEITDEDILRGGAAAIGSILGMP